MEKSNFLRKDWQMIISTKVRKLRMKAWNYWKISLYKQLWHEARRLCDKSSILMSSIGPMEDVLTKRLSTEELPNLFLVNKGTQSMNKWSWEIMTLLILKPLNKMPRNSMYINMKKENTERFLETGWELNIIQTCLNGIHIGFMSLAFLQ
jgi:hypothetical protein